MSHRETPEAPQVYSDGKNIVISLDGSGGVDREGKRIVQRPGSGSLHFSITRSGKFKFAKKVITKKRYETRDKVDEDGNKIPNPVREKQLKHFGVSHADEFESERVLLEEPEVKLEYDVNSEWWRRHAFTTIHF